VVAVMVVCGTKKTVQQQCHSLSHQTHIQYAFNLTAVVFSALTLLFRHQEEHPACKKLSDEVLVWSGARCR